MPRTSTRLLYAAVAALLSVAPPARAVVGGAEVDGALKASTVMVLGSAGNVCTGIVVAPTAVLTAGHCATNAAEHRIHYMDGGGQPVLLSIADVAVHPNYDAGAIKGRRRSIDLALVRLATPLPARFVPAGLTAAAVPPRAGTRVVLGGYGADGKGRSDGRFRSAELSVAEPYGPGTVLLWLAPGAGAAAAGGCEGDSGGPIARGDAVIAVTTWSKGNGRAACGAMTQGVLVGPQRGWIDRTLAAWGADPRWR
ncbi:S1 family peptidase [Chelatococcus reniformis]|uniref:Peptidase S1 domain-containing protein n=1 Tax=Chelatococcus reniformis TaxID=1494448 RepID=A0A916UI10_9HYPH|nr:S1 family peptidase [Chelatococcus reniformis]GGC73624.1 hypothetical protein GCM10010994_35000 [Chelatococcus reniformis]